MRRTHSQYTVIMYYMVIRTVNAIEMVQRKRLYNREWRRSEFSEW
jgi:hypothetical protein